MANTSIQRLRVQDTDLYNGAILQSYNDAMADLTDEQTAGVAACLLYLKETIPPSTIMSPAIFSYTSMHAAIRSVLDCLGKKTSRGSGISVLLSVAHVLYKGCDELLQDARDRHKIRQQEGKAPRTSTTNAPGGIDNPHAPLTPQYRGGDREAELSVKRSQSMSSRFRDSEKYSSDIDDPTTLRKTLERFSCACKELGIPREEQAGLLHHVLKGAANDFYFGEMQSHIPNGTLISLQEAYTLLSKKYETKERQQQVRSNLQSLRLSAIQQLEACDKLKALTFAYNKISKFIDSCPPGFCSEVKSHLGSHFLTPEIETIYTAH
jgi:hypothetical protein